MNYKSDCKEGNVFGKKPDVVMKESCNDSLRDFDIKTIRKDGDDGERKISRSNFDIVSGDSRNVSKHKMDFGMSFENNDTKKGNIYESKKNNDQLEIASYIRYGGGLL